MTNKLHDSYVVISSESLPISDNQPTNLPIPPSYTDWYDWCEQAEPLLTATADQEYEPIIPLVQPEPCQPETNHIPIVTGNRPKPTEPEKRPHSARITLRRNNKAVTALSLPNLWGANHRSLWPRLENTLDELVELQAHVGFHCEVWENKENKKHAIEIEKAYELRGVMYISTARPDRVGGGAAITLLRESPFSLKN